MEPRFVEDLGVDDGFAAGMEPERYELAAPPPYRFDVDRRSFFQIAGGGIAIAILLSRAAEPQERRRRSGRGGGRTPQEIGAWLHIGEDGAVTVYTGKAEVGQNIRTSLAQAVADELSLPLDSVRLVMADTNLTPYDAGTFGSRTTPSMSRQLRQAAAAARELLIDRAAETWKTDRSLLSVSGGRIVHRETKAGISFGDLTKGQKLIQTVSDEVPTQAADHWQVAGRSAKKVNGRDIVTGRHRYSSDIALPGMLHGKVLRAVASGATLAKVDTAAVEALEGVTVVRDGDFVGVTAPTELAAAQAIDAIQAEWQTAPQVSDRDLFDHLRRAAGEGGGRGGNRAGSIEAGLADADIQLKQTYTIAYIAHAPLEPRAAVAQWENEKLTVWTGTQRPFGVRGELAEAFRIPEERLHVIVPDTGSGYGGKHSGEAAIEAARLARAAGKPVKLVWTREEEFAWAYFRPAGVIDVTSGVRKDGTLTAWEFHNYNSGASAIRTLYEVPNQRIEFHSARSPLRQGSYRALASTANVFARETAMDELAHAVSMEPLEFRLKNLRDPRFRAVLEAAADDFGWTKGPPEGHGYGIGGGFEKGSYVATCAEVAVDRASGRLRVVRATSAFECGAIVNPDQLKNQVEGALVMGLGGALFEHIQFENGQITNAGFSGYRVPRFSDLPEINVVLLDRQDLPSEGAGETPIVGIAPAIGNAIFAAAGIRLRSLPLAPNGIKI